MKIDIVTQFVTLARETAGLDERVAREIDARIRAEHGGRTVKIAERAPITPEFVDQRLRERKTVRMIAGEVGLSRATIYRILGNKSFKKRDRVKPGAV